MFRYGLAEDAAKIEPPCKTLIDSIGRRVERRMGAVDSHVGGDQVVHPPVVGREVLETLKRIFDLSSGGQDRFLNRGRDAVGLCHLPVRLLESSPALTVMSDGSIW